MIDPLKTDMDAAGQLLVMTVMERLRDGDAARAAFDHWRSSFEAASEHPDQGWIRTSADNALTELLPHLK